MASKFLLSRLWIIDSGETKHITCEEGTLESSHSNGDVTVTIPNGKRVQVKGIGNVTLPKWLKDR